MCREPFSPEIRVVTVAQGAEADDPGIQPGVADIGDAAHLPAAFLAGDLDFVDEGPMGRMSFEFIPALDGTLFQFVFVADHLVVAAVIADPDGQGQAPVAFLGDHPIMHIPQPIQLAFMTKLRDPADLVDHIHDLVAQGFFFLLSGDLLAWFVIELAHADEPLIHQAEDQFGLAAPAGGVAVGIGFDVVEHAFLFQVFEDRVGDIRDMRAGKPAKPIHKIAFVLNRGQQREVVFFAQLEVLRAAARGDMDDARTFALADFIPQDDLVGLGGVDLDPLDQFRESWSPHRACWPQVDHQKDHRRSSLPSLRL